MPKEEIRWRAPRNRSSGITRGNRVESTQDQKLRKTRTPQEYPGEPEESKTQFGEEIQEYPGEPEESKTQFGEEIQGNGGAQLENSIGQNGGIFN